MKNRRNPIRVDFVKIAQLATADGTVVLNCQVRDISSHGVKLVITDYADLPEHVMSQLPLDGVTWPRPIVRRRGSETGVQFTDRYGWRR